MGTTTRCTLTPAEARAYADLARAARRLRDAQRRAELARERAAGRRRQRERGRQ
jgi:hypothetical protein